MTTDERIVLSKLKEYAEDSQLDEKDALQLRILCAIYGYECENHFDKNVIKSQIIRIAKFIDEIDSWYQRQELHKMVEQLAKMLGYNLPLKDD